MNILAALVLFGLAGYAGSIALDGWRDGAMRAPFWKGSNAPAFSRITSPAWFFGAAAIHIALVVVLAVSGIIVLTASWVHR